MSFEVGYLQHVMCSVVQHGSDENCWVDIRRDIAIFELHLHVQLGQVQATELRIWKCSPARSRNFSSKSMNLEMGISTRTAQVTDRQTLAAQAFGSAQEEFAKLVKDPMLNFWLGQLVVSSALDGD